MIAHARWHEVLRAALSAGERAVLVTVAAIAGSTPREAGAEMVVTPSRVAGTIGGGHLEYEALRLAHQALQTPGQPAQWLVRFPLAARLGQCCGGVATLSFATLDESALPWLEVVDACVRARTPFAVVGCIAPGAHAGGRLVVTADDARGSLGNAALDSTAVAQARARLAPATSKGRDPTGLCNAGGDTLFVHVIVPDTFAVCVFGNGHVGRALVQVLGAVLAKVRWIDSREHDFPAQVPGNVEIVVTDDPTAEVATAPHGANLVVMTHSHALDFDIIETALARDDWAYLGLIGSKAKRAQFERRLLARGTAPDALARLTSPIGVGPLRSKAPGVIAIAAAAELLALRESRDVKPLGVRPAGVRPHFHAVTRPRSRWNGENGV